MNHIWRVTVHLNDDRGFDVFNVQAPDDRVAREKGIACMERDTQDPFTVMYVELEHLLEFEVL